MKVKNLKQWDLFYNTNGYVSLVYIVTNGHIDIINNHGSIYQMNRASTYSYDNRVPDQTVEEFFKNFPTWKLSHHSSRMEFFKLQDDYHSQKTVWNLLLLL